MMPTTISAEEKKSRLETGHFELRTLQPHKGLHLCI